MACRRARWRTCTGPRSARALRSARSPSPPISGRPSREGTRHLMKRIGRRLLVGGGVLLALAGSVLLLDRLLPADLSRLSQLSVLVEDKDGALLRAFTAKDGSWRLPITVAAVDPRFRRMLLAYEDKRFDSHWGVDPLALMRALG